LEPEVERDVAATAEPSGDAQGAHELPPAGRHRRVRRTVLVIAAMILVVLVVAEGAARLLGPYLPEPLVYGDEATQVKVEQLDALGPACVDVVVAGNSMGRDAFDPQQFTAADPEHRRAYNASLDAASPELLERWVLEEVVPRLHPSTVVIPVASLDLNAHSNATTSALAAYDAAPATKPGWFTPVERRVVELSSLVGYRTELRDPQTVVDAVGRWRAGTPAERLSVAGIAGVLGAEGQGLSRRPLRYRGDAGTKAFTKQQLLADYTIDGQQEEAISRLVGALQQQGIAPVLAVLPVTEDYIGLHPRGRADFDAFLREVQSLSSRDGVPLLDLHDAQAGSEAFADTHHLNEAGATWFSSTLPTKLASAATLRGRRCPA
jgi:hypothetical protein